VKQRHHQAGILSGAPSDFAVQSAFAQVTGANTLRELLQVLLDPRDVPAAADKVPDDGVKEIAAVGAFRRASAHDLLDLLDAVAATVAIKAITSSRRSSFRSCSPAALAPDHGPVKHVIDVRQLADRVELVAGDRQRLVGAPE